MVCFFDREREVIKSARRCSNYFMAYVFITIVCSGSADLTPKIRGCFVTLFAIFEIFDRRNSLDGLSASRFSASFLSGDDLPCTFARLIRPMAFPRL